MFTKGEFTTNGVTYGAVLKHTKLGTEAVLVNSGTVVSAYKTDGEDSYSYSNVRAKELVQLVLSGVKSCNSKNGVAQPFVLGAMQSHEFIKNKTEYNILLHRGEVVGAYITASDKKVTMEYLDTHGQNIMPTNIPYIKLSRVRSKELEESDNDLDAIQTKSVQEIALEKESIAWFDNKRYSVIKDDAVAEGIFQVLDNFDGPIAYDTETTGLKINCFGMINSEYQKSLIEYNEKNKDNPIRADKLVGIIFCIEENVSYYFPCANRKFKNLYEDRTSPYRNAIINNTKARYTVGDLRNNKDCVAEYWRNTPADDISEDCVLMERVRNILETKHIVAHNGSFEYKVGMQYNIDTNLKDDTMIMHQVVYKFRNGGRAEPSNLKHLSKVELGIDQWELHDFFPNWKPDKDGLVRRKPGSKLTTANQIDFSYMDEQGTRAYAPTDGDCTLGLFNKFKPDMIKNHKDQIYIYNVEVLVSCAIGYMEFYGHKIDEAKIMGARAATLAEKSMIESEVREEIGQGYRGQKELEAYNNLKAFIANKKESGLSDEEYDNQLIALTEILDKAIADDKEHIINLGSSAQVCDLFYNKMGIPMEGDKPSVAKKPLKALMKAKNDDGTNKYPIVHMYSDYKGKETLLSKFFDNLIYFMYPGGFIFSSFGQIATNTGRMSCSKPNAQQYPKVIAKIIIPRKDCITFDADYSQIEYRVITALAKNDYLAELFSNPDSDYHTLMASLMYDVDYSAVTGAMRSAAKSFNFGIPYGMGLGSLAILLTGKNTPQTRQEAAEKQVAYFKNQPRTKQFLDSVKEQAEVNGYTTTQFCRYRYYNFTDKDGNTNNAIRASALRQAGNAVIQGCLGEETLIQTKEYGITKIKDVVDKHLHVWDGAKWTEGDILYSGQKQKCIITFTNGQQFVCSPIHKFLVKSTKGNERFVECKDLHTVENSKNAHRIVITRKYESSDWKYSSDWAREKYTSNHGSAKNVFLDDMSDSFKIGVVLGRLASDGNITNVVDKARHYSIRQIIAEHEADVYKILLDYMRPLGTTEYHVGIREGRTEDLMHLNVNSKSLVSEVLDLDVKHQIHPEIMQDTEMLRGFLRGMFDGDGGISGKTITLVFGTQADFEPMCRQIQKALLFFGIRSRFYKYDYRYKITIKTNDNQKFLDTIGFVGKDKQAQGRQLECIKDEHIFGQVLIPQSVEITDEYIDMYDVCNTDDGYYVADGLITHNTAADIFKIGVARNFSFIRRNKLFGKLFIINMIHDEQLMEINYKELNVLKIVTEVGKNMQFKLDGYPPLYIGGGIGKAWGYAKGKAEEIHPTLLAQYTKEAENMPIYRTDEQKATEPEPTLDSVYNYFHTRVVKFREQKVYDYLNDPNNWHKIIHPAISGLINLQFNYGRGDDAKAYKGPNGETYSDQEFLELNITDFLNEHNIPAKASWFSANDNKAEDEEVDAEYSEDEDEDDLMDAVEGDEDVKSFKLVDDSDKTYGASVRDMIDTFGACLLKKQQVCGINVKDMYFRKKNALIDELSNYVCEKDNENNYLTDENSYQIVFLNDANQLLYTNVWIHNMDTKKLDNIYRLNNYSETDYTKGDVKTRSQAK